MAESMTVEARIAHFLRVSEDAGATQAERDTAGREAERLLAKHAIDRLTLPADGATRAARETIERRTLLARGGKGTIALDVVVGLIAAAEALGLVAHYRDRRIPIWDAPAEEPGVELVVTGFASDLDLALPLLESLRTQATVAMWAWWRAEPMHRRIPRYDALLARCDFARSFGLGAAERLRTTRAAAVESTGTALVVASRESAVRDWVAANLRTRRVTDRRSFSGYGRGQGFTAGLRSTGTAQRALGR
ncbi:hypothetical protein [Amnibacterium endophyticum]|uniref:DUF2786 domain-containing protein n=1 Tax=Amnibacterium endophyticum TaxID=2109337 RepID=A0ABW4LBI1_9MICO